MTCKCHYEGRTSTEHPYGKTFDSSYKRGPPDQFRVDQVIGCWTEAMQLMLVGSKWELVCPPKLAYGDKALEGIPADSVLVFTMEMLSCRSDVTVTDSDTGTTERQSMGIAGYLRWIPALIGLLWVGFVLRHFGQPIFNEHEIAKKRV